jgi:hypothetical protein
MALNSKTQLAIVIAMHDGLKAGLTVKSVFEKLKDLNVANAGDGWAAATAMYEETNSIPNALFASRIFDREVIYALSFANFSTGNCFAPAVDYLTAVVAGS